MNPLLDIINEVVEEDQFSIKTDESAEWALSKIREEQTESQRLISACESQISFYQDRIKREKDRVERETGNLKSLLFDYFQTVPRKSSKTQETYSLPSGKLKLKYPQPEYKRDDATLIKWLKERNMTDYIKTKEEPQWGELKKATKIAGDKACIDGEIIDGIEIVERQPEFDIEI